MALPFADRLIRLALALNVVFGAAWNGMQEELIERLVALGATISEGAFAPVPAVWVGRREVAHFDARRLLDIRLTRTVIRQRRAELGSDDRVIFRAGTSDWLEIRLSGPDDLEFALDLVRAAIAANTPSAPRGAPPTGAELERRRRFH